MKVTDAKMPGPVASYSREQQPLNGGRIRSAACGQRKAEIDGGGIERVNRWNAITAKWDFVAPRATLFAEQNYFGEVGTHYAGPKWESKSGSIVDKLRRIRYYAPYVNGIGSMI